MKLLKRISAFVLTAALMSGMLVGCQMNPGSNSVGHAGHIETGKQNILTPVEDSQVVFLSEGTSEYKIVQPQNADENEQFAAKELQYFVEQASGAKLEIVTESADMGNGKYIFVGATTASSAAGVVPTYEQTKYNGFIMVFQGDDLYLRGYSSIGTRNSIYEFLDYLFDYDYYAPDEIYVSNVKTANMPAFDLTVTPSFEWRTSNYGWAIWGDRSDGHRMRMNHAEEMYINGWNCHFCYDIIDPSVYDYTNAKYKDWYSSKVVSTSSGSREPAQLCYSRSEEMEKTYIENLLKIIAESDKDVIILGQADHPWWCECSSCQAWEDQYGTNAAVMIPFLNRVQAAVDAWFAENRPGEQPTMCVIFAYQETVTPPSKWNEQTQSWEPMDETMIINPNSGVMFAPIDMECDKAFSDYDPDDNTNPYGQLLGWGALTDNIFSWTYSQVFNDLFLTYNTFETVQKNMQTLIESGAVSYYDETQSDSTGYITGWNMVKSYLLSKLQWDNSLNQEELLRDFFQHYYEDAADVMYDIFMEERLWLNHVYNDLGANGGVWEDMVTATYWPYNWLNNILERFEDAYAALEPLRERDPERYTLVHDRILLETLQFRYLKLSLYSVEYDERELQNTKLEFRYDCERLDIQYHSHRVKIKELWKEWGIS